MKAPTPQLWVALLLPIVAFAVLVVRAELLRASGPVFRVAIAGYDPRDRNSFPIGDTNFLAGIDGGVAGLRVACYDQTQAGPQTTVRPRRRPDCKRLFAAWHVNVIQVRVSDGTGQ